MSWLGNNFPDVSSTRLLSKVNGTGDAGVVLKRISFNNKWCECFRVLGDIAFQILITSY